MKRRSEHLVRKRDGRTEFLRATKLARSVHLALKSVGVDEDWRALEVGAAVLAGVRRRLDPRAEMALPVAVEPGPGRSTGVEVTTEMLAEAVQRVLIANGQAAAAVAFGAVATERSRHRTSLATLGRAQATEGPALLLPVTAALARRLPKE